MLDMKRRVIAIATALNLPDGLASDNYFHDLLRHGSTATYESNVLNLHNAVLKISQVHSQPRQVSSKIYEYGFYCGMLI